jgi:hypothetical protein
VNLYLHVSKIIFLCCPFGYTISLSQNLWPLQKICKFEAIQIMHFICFLNQFLNQIEKGKNQNLKKIEKGHGDLFGPSRKAGPAR